MQADSLDHATRTAPVIHTPLTTARVEFPGGNTKFLMLPKTFDIMKEWVDFKKGHEEGTKAEGDKFLKLLETKGIMELDGITEETLILD